MLDIVAFCDASHSSRTKRAVACSIILSDNMFHGIVTRTYTKVDTGARAELLGIIQTVEYLKNMVDVGQITLYCDSRSMVTLYSRMLKSGVVAKQTNYVDDWLHLLDISEGMDITPNHIHGHTDELTCNTICDTVAHSVLRWENT